MSLLSSGTGDRDRSVLREFVSFNLCFLPLVSVEESPDSSEVLSPDCIESERRLRRERLLDFIVLDFLLDALGRSCPVSSWILPIIFNNNSLVDGNLSGVSFN